MPLTPSQIGNWLAGARGRAGLSQRKVAEFLDTDAGTVSRWERGDSQMSAASFLALVQFYRAADLLAQLVTPGYDSAAPTRRVAESGAPGIDPARDRKLTDEEIARAERAARPTAKGKGATGPRRRPA